MSKTTGAGPQGMIDPRGMIGPQGPQASGGGAIGPTGGNAGGGAVGPVAPPVATPSGGGSLAPGSWTATNPLPGGDVTDQSYQRTYGVPQYYMPPGATVSGVRGLTGEQQDFYNLDTDPYTILGSRDDVTRSALVSVLKSRGWYGNLQAGDGLMQNDISVMRDVLEYSNLRGWTWDRTINEIKKMPAVGSGRPRVQVTSKADLTEIAKRVALETIGRTMSDQELARFIGSYQDAQRAEAGGSAEQAPQADTFFKQRIEKAYGRETDAYKHLVAISNVANLLEKL